MGRKKEYISKINNKDIQAFRLLYYTHHVPRSLMNISENRLKSYIKQGLAERCISISRNEPIIRCTDNGRKYIGKLDGFVGHKPYQNAIASEHNVLLAYKFSCLTAEQQNNWYSEKDLWNIYQKKLDELRETDFKRWQETVDNPHISSCDGGVITQNGIELIEIITNGYTETYIDGKQSFAEVMNATINYYHT